MFIIEFIASTIMVLFGLGLILLLLSMFAPLFIATLVIFCIMLAALVGNVAVGLITYPFGSTYVQVTDPPAFYEPHFLIRNLDIRACGFRGTNKNLTNPYPYEWRKRNNIDCVAVVKKYDPSNTGLIKDFEQEKKGK